MSQVHRSHRQARRRFVAIGLLACAQCARGQTWSGGSPTNDTWSTALNWVGGVAPANNATADIVFAGNTRLTPIVAPAQSIHTLTFNNTAGAFIFGGTGPLTISSGVTNNDT